MRPQVTGRVELTVPTAAVTLVLARLLPRFIERHPKVELDVRVEDRLVNMVAEVLDAGIRLVEAIDRDMVHVRLTAAARIVVVAAPSYLERRGTPQKPQDLLQHDCICMRWSPSGEPGRGSSNAGRKRGACPCVGR
jgi:DNA-binding transcriptional LysR family regulator